VAVIVSSERFFYSLVQNSLPPNCTQFVSYEPASAWCRNCGGNVLNHASEELEGLSLSDCRGRVMVNKTTPAFHCIGCLVHFMPGGSLKPLNQLREGHTRGHEPCAHQKATTTNAEGKTVVWVAMGCHKCALRLWFCKDHAQCAVCLGPMADLPKDSKYYSGKCHFCILKELKEKEAEDIAMPALEKSV
jgi:hypothetical protein